jgi:hypothetical protein
MLKSIEENSRNLSLATLLATVAMTGIHHIYRFGPDLIAPVLMGLILPVVLIYLLERTRRNVFAAVYAVYVGLIVFWFGFLDGFLDHVLKVSGVENLTFLPGSEEAIVATYYQFGSLEVSAAIYEWTGVLSAVLALATTVFTALYLARLFARDPQSAQ